MEFDEFGVLTKVSDEQLTKKNAWYIRYTHVIGMGM